MRLLSLKNLKKSFGDKEILNIDSLDIDAGGVIGVAGPNGSGKTTLLEILAGLKKQNSGRVDFYHEKRENAGLKSLVIVLQNPLMFNSSVFNNVAFGLKAKGISGNEIDEKVNAELESFDLLHLKDRNARTLSGGEKQRVAIARANILNPKVLILDEPTSGLDFQSRATLINLIQRLNENDETRTIFVASHDKDFLHTVAHKTYVLLNKNLSLESVENFFHAQIIEVNRARINRDFEIQVSSEKVGEANIIIPPDSLVLSKDKLDTSMRNSMCGHVSKVSHDNNANVLVWVNLGVDICCRITKASYRDMNIHLGDKLWISFKATSVKLFYRSN